MLNDDDAPASTKACPCGETRLVLLRSINRKLCPTCRGSIIWPLDAGQKALVRPNRADIQPAGLNRSGIHLQPTNGRPFTVVAEH